jgi:hypothetical protein
MGSAELYCLFCSIKTPILDMCKSRIVQVYPMTAAAVRLQTVWKSRGFVATGRAV